MFHKKIKKPKDFIELLVFLLVSPIIGIVMLVGMVGTSVAMICMYIKEFIMEGGLMNKIKFYWDIISPSLTIMLIGTIMFFVIGIALSIPLCLIWNWLMPSIFDLPTINVLFYRRLAYRYWLHTISKKNRFE